MPTFLNDFMLQPLAVVKTYGKNDISDSPVCKHTDPYSHRSHMKDSGKNCCKSNTTEPHGKYRYCHAEFYITCSTKSVSRDKCHIPYQWFDNGDAGNHKDTEFCTFRFHTSEYGNRSGNGIHKNTGKNQCNFSYDTKFFYVINSFFFMTGSKCFAHHSHQSDTYSDGKNTI